MSSDHLYTDASFLKKFFVNDTFKSQGRFCSTINNLKIKKQIKEYLCFKMPKIYQESNYFKDIRERDN